MLDDRDNPHPIPPRTNRGTDQETSRLQMSVRALPIPHSPTVHLRDSRISRRSRTTAPKRTVHRRRSPTIVRRRISRITARRQIARLRHSPTIVPRRISRITARRQIAPLRHSPTIVPRRISRITARRQIARRPHSPITVPRRISPTTARRRIARRPLHRITGRIRRTIGLSRLVLRRIVRNLRPAILPSLRHSRTTVRSKTGTSQLRLRGRNRPSASSNNSSSALHHPQRPGRRLRLSAR